MLISLVVAMSRQGVIGKDGQLPWHLPRDLKRFREVTWGKPIVMGRKTHQSIGRPLPGRSNLILTHQADYTAEGCRIVHSVSEAIDVATALAATELMVIGGRQVYDAFLPTCRAIHLTLVEGTFDGDTFFPIDLLASPDWAAVREEAWPADARNPFDATYRVLHRRGRAAT
jgi:dihydrofolate reductase